MSQRSAHRILCVLWTIAGLGLCGPAGAGRAFGQEVILHLRNGDRVSGFIISETTNRVVLTNAWSAGITVSPGDIVRREASVRPALQGSTGANRENGENISVPLFPLLPPVQPAATNAVAAAPPKPALTNVVPPRPGLLLFGEVQLGVDLGYSEKNRQLYTGRAKMSLNYHRLRNLFDYSFSYGRTEGVVSANRMDGSIKTDYDLTSRSYVYNLAGAGYDEIRKIESRYEIGPGIGYQLVKRTNFLFKGEAGINYQAQYFTDDTRSEMFFYRFAEEGVWKINHRLTFDEKFEFFPEVEDFTGGYRFRFESNLRYALMNNLFFTLTVLDQYDTEPPAGVGPNDLQVRSTLGVKF